jgi:hypothetical protein
MLALADVRFIVHCSLSTNWVVGQFDHAGGEPEMGYAEYPPLTLSSLFVDIVSRPYDAND